LHRDVGAQSAEIAVRQIVGLVVGGLMLAAGAYSVTRGVSGGSLGRVVFAAAMAGIVFGFGVVAAGIAQWHRKVYC
jgi:hypothetical protein